MNKTVFFSKNRCKILESKAVLLNSASGVRLMVPTVTIGSLKESQRHQLMMLRNQPIKRFVAPVSMNLDTGFVTVQVKINGLFSRTLRQRMLILQERLSSTSQETLNVELLLILSYISVRNSCCAPKLPALLFQQL